MRCDLKRASNDQKKKIRKVFTIGAFQIPLVLERGSDILLELCADE